MRAALVVSLTVSTLVLASCGGGSTEEPATGSGAGSDVTAGGDTEGPSAAAAGDPADLPAMPEGISGPPTPWDEMSPQAKARYMEEHVVPAMRPLFAAYDPSRSGPVGCGSCHGRDARARNFAMPSPSLPPLPAPTDSAAWAALQASSPRAMAFMGSRVGPVMAQLVGEPPFDPATHEGFGCFECHTQAQ